MGDRCYLTVRLHGKIETIEDFNAVIEAIDAEFMVPEDGHGHGKDSIRRYLLASDGEPGFYADEVNYANIDDLESSLQEIGLPYHVSHDAGGGYPGAVWTWRPIAGKIEATRAEGSGPVIEIEELRRALKSDDPLKLISEIVADADAADGAGLPPFALSDAVRQHFAHQSTSQPH